MKINVAKPYIDEQEQKAVADAIASGWISQGPRVQEFEKIFAKNVGAQYAVATTSGTTALHAALSISGICRGDEVLVPSLSFIATANAIVHCGATPVFVDVDPDTCNIDVQQIESAITNKTKAIIPVHQMGVSVDIDTIQTIVQKYNLTLIEDAACALGSEYKGRRIGGHGNLACFSFHPRKVITTGEGGMITTDDLDIATRLKKFRHHGMSGSDLERHHAQSVIIENYPEIGYNYRMTDIQAAMGIVQMKKLSDILEKRRSIATRYNNAFSTHRFLRMPKFPEYCVPNYQSYWLEVREDSPLSRNALMQKLLEKRISTRRGVMAIHLEPCYSTHNVHLPHTERLALQSIVLPLYPSMNDDEVLYVINAVCDVLH